jgi:hypothetical protein
VPAAAFRACLASSGLEQALVAASRQAKTERELLRRAHIWFDGFRTLKLVHRIRAVLAPQIDWQTALAAAPFCGSSAGVSGLAPAFVVEQLAGLVAQQPGLLGPTCIAGYTGDDLM